MLIDCVAVHPDAKLPTKNFPSDAAFNVYCVEPITVGVRSTPVRLGLAMEIPEGYFVKLEGRSGLARDFGVKVDGVLTNGEIRLGGIIDSHFRGEVIVLLSTLPAMGNKTFKVGDKICQMILHEVLKANFMWSKSGKLSGTDRGASGFGDSDRPVHPFGTIVPDLPGNPG